MPIGVQRLDGRQQLVAGPAPSVRIRILARNAAGMTAITCSSTTRWSATVFDPALYS